MSLFGAMNSGVSGLASQSSAMAAISDNITNVNTVGYKGTEVDFQTLVTRQASNSLYSSGGVQSRPRTGIDVQGLLQTSSSATDLAISGDGFFLVNEAAQPGASDQYLFSRAGSFYTDNLGYLKNTGGYYLQAWPTDRQGNIILPSGNTGLTNQNIISGQFLETVNLNRVGGTADETTNISIGANLPANDSVGAGHDVDVRRRVDGRDQRISDHARLRLARRGGRHYAVERRVHPQLHRAERRALRCVQRRHHLLGRVGFGAVRQRRAPPHLPSSARHLRQSGRSRSADRQRLEHHRGLRQPDLAGRGFRSGGADRAVLVGSLDRRYRRRIHRHDRRAESLFGGDPN